MASTGGSLVVVSHGIRVSRVVQKNGDQLHDSPHALWAALYYSAQHKFDYWLRHMPPAEVGDAAARIDAAR